MEDDVRTEGRKGAGGASGGGGGCQGQAGPALSLTHSAVEAGGHLGTTPCSTEPHLRQRNTAVSHRPKLGVRESDTAGS